MILLLSEKEMACGVHAIEETSTYHWTEVHVADRSAEYFCLFMSGAVVSFLASKPNRMLNEE
jgi:hypothetical protein